MTTLLEIQNQIAQLQKQAEEIKAAEIANAVQDIKAKMAAYGITIADLQGSSKGRMVKSAGKSSTPAPVKYRGPNGETWSGRGLMPRWLAGQVALGKSKDSFAV
jgi:DNA-binding protein H-NS